MASSHMPKSEKDTKSQKGHIYANISVNGSSNKTQLGDVHYHGNYVDPDIQCLKDLWPTNPEHDKARIQLSKGGLLRQSYIWILKNSDFQQWCDNQTRILWVKGDPGKGKTMLLCGIIDELKKSIREGLLCFFFCQVTDPRTSNAVGVLRGLIRQIVVQQPLLMAHVRKEYDSQEKEAFVDINAWIVLSRIFIGILEDQALEGASLIIDALDECTMNDRTLLLDLIIQVSAIHPNIKWIVSSRNSPSIEDHLNLTMQKVILSLNHEKSISTAVNIYIENRVEELAKLKSYDKNMRDTVHNYLSSHAKDTFLWVSLVCQELASPKVRRHHTLSKLYAFPSGLGSLYERMMDQIRDSEDTELCNRILAIISIVYRPITLDELMSFIDMPDNLESPMEIIELCGSFLTVQGYTILFIHPSVKDFLFGKVSKEVFPFGIETVHYTIFSRSLYTMAMTLQRGIYNLKSPGFSINKEQRPDPDPLAAVQYSCIHWADHLVDSRSSQTSVRNFQEDGTVDLFLRDHLILPDQTSPLILGLLLYRWLWVMYQLQPLMVYLAPLSTVRGLHRARKI